MALRWLITSAFTQVFGRVDTMGAHHGDVMACQSEQLLVQEYGKSYTKSGTIRGGSANGFQMPLHYPRYRQADYEKMEEWKLDMLLNEYGLSFQGTLDEKRAYAIGTFLWPDQL